jgi:CP family cyanate transporter-like MFS transporter
MRSLSDHKDFPGGRADTAGSPGRPSRVRTGQSTRAATIWQFIALLLLAANLRPALASVGPVLDRIGAADQLSGAELALLIALPVLCFALLAPMAPVMVVRLGLERTIAVALVVVLVGMLARVGPGVAALMAGTIVAGAGIAVCNVLLPVLVKRTFPHRVGLVTGAYTTMINVSAATAAAATAPVVVASGGTWRIGLAVWVLPVVPAMAIWVRLSVRADRERSGHAAVRHSWRLFQDRTARYVIAFTATQSVLYYSVLSWLPSIYLSHGYTETRAGLLLAVTTLISAPVALVVPSLAGRATSQRAHAASVAACAALGLAGVLLAPTAAPYVWAVFIGIGLGGAFPLALTMFVLRTHHESETGSLSMVAQATSYLVAAAGPLAIGILHDATNSWNAGLAILVSVAILELVFGLEAGRPRQIGHLAIFDKDPH